MPERKDGDGGKKGFKLQRGAGNNAIVWLEGGATQRKANGLERQKKKNSKKKR